MMSQNRQASINRVAMQTHFQINAKAELEIERLHQRVGLLRETEVSELIRVLRCLEARVPPQDRAWPGAMTADGQVGSSRCRSWMAMPPLIEDRFNHSGWRRVRKVSA